MLDLFKQYKYGVFCSVYGSMLTQFKGVSLFVVHPVPLTTPWVGVKWRSVQTHPVTLPLAPVQFKPACMATHWCWVR